MVFYSVLWNGFVWFMVKSKDYFEKPDYKFLVEENLKLRQEITGLEQEVLETKADNTKLVRKVEDKIDQLRKSGM